MAPTAHGKSGGLILSAALTAGSYTEMCELAKSAVSYLCACVCVCVHVGVHACARVCMYLCVQVSAGLCTCVYLCVHVCMQVCARVCMCVRACVFMHESVCVCTHTCACVHVFTCLCVHVCARVCLCVCVRDRRGQNGDGGPREPRQSTSAPRHAVWVQHTSRSFRYRLRQGWAAGPGPDTPRWPLRGV